MFPKHPLTLSSEAPAESFPNHPLIYFRITRCILSESPVGRFPKYSLTYFRITR